MIDLLNKNDINSRKRLVVGIVALAGILVHSFYAFKYYQIGLTGLSIANAVSVAIWLGGWVMNRQGFSFYTVIILTLEIMIHVFICVTLVGWDAGYQNYLFGVIPFILFNNRLSGKLVGIVAATTTLFFIILYLYSKEWTTYQLSEADTTLFYVINSIVGFFALSVSGIHYKYVTSRSLEHVYSLANTDELTSLSNRRKGKAVLNSWIYGEQFRPLSIIVCDIDNFKDINDRFGHDAGDAIIQQISEYLIKATRETEVVARWGGEEFMIGLPYAAKSQAEMVAERIRQAVEEATFSYKRITIRTTMTFGIAEYTEGQTLDEWLKEADMNLYKGKQLGKNQVII